MSEAKSGRPAAIAIFASAKAAFPKRMEVKPHHRKVVVYLLAVLIAIFGLLVFGFRPRETGQCGPKISEYKNSRYGYEIKAPEGWRLATKIIQAVNIGIPIKNAEFVYFTQLNCGDELRISAGVPQSDPFSGGPDVTQEVDLGNIFVVFANVSDGGVNFADSANKIRFDNTTVAPVEDVRTELLDSGVSAARYELRGSLEAQPLATVFVPDFKNQDNAFGHPVKGFTIQAGGGKFFSEDAFSSFYRSFKYLP